MKRCIKALSLILVLAVACSSLCVTAKATEIRASNYFATYSTYLWKVSGTTFQVWFDVTAVGTMTELGVRDIQIQRSTDNSNWTTVRTYNKANYPQMTCANTAGHSDCVTYTGSTGYYYRALVTFYASNSSGTGILYRYTDTFKY